MIGLWALLRRNQNYRRAWVGQVVSEIGDYFNNIAVFALVMEKSGSGLVVSGVMLSRAIPAMLAGPVAGVLLDRFDRKRIMIASDLVRAAVALAFVLTIHRPSPWLLYALSAALMFASPFFTSGRAAILPAIEAARARGIACSGPHAGDTIFLQAFRGAYDLVVAMYHDQGHIALKLLGMHRAVNVTLGLPIIRTSVAHGTAFDIAWHRRAETQSLLEALRVAAQLAQG